jgi:hypothetical protein
MLPASFLDGVTAAVMKAFEVGLSAGLRSRRPDDGDEVVRDGGHRSFLSLWGVPTSVGIDGRASQGEIVLPDAGGTRTRRRA